MCECYQIGGRFIAEDPYCPAHGREAQQREQEHEEEMAKLRATAFDPSKLKIDLSLNSGKLKVKLLYDNQKIDEDHVYVSAKTIGFQR